MVNSNDQASFIEAQRAQVVLQLQQQGLDEQSIQLAMQEFDLVVSSQLQQQNQFLTLLTSENYKVQLHEYLKHLLAAMMADKSATFPLQQMLAALKSNYQEAVEFGVYTKSKVFVEGTLKNLLCFNFLPL